jgi:hypothetical protein
VDKKEEEEDRERRKKKKLKAGRTFTRVENRIDQVPWCADKPAQQPWKP